MLGEHGQEYDAGDASRRAPAAAAHGDQAAQQ